MSKGIASPLRKEWDLESKTELQVTESYPTSRVFLPPNDTCINSTFRLGQRLRVCQSDRLQEGQNDTFQPALTDGTPGTCAMLGAHCSSFVVTQEHMTDSGRWIQRRYNGVAFLSCCKCTRLIGRMMAERGSFSQPRPLRRVTSPLKSVTEV